MAAARLLFCVALLGLLTGAVGWNPTCTGEFVCSSVATGDPTLYTQWFNNGSVICKYGHTEARGHCERPCEGRRSAPCRCQTQEEAEQAISGGAKTSLIVSGVAFLVGLCCTCCACRSARRVQMKLQETDFRGGGGEGGVGEDGGAASESAGQAERAAEEGAASGSQAEPPAANPAAAAGGAAASAGAGETSPASAAGSSSPSSGGTLGRIAAKTQEKAMENPKKFRCLRWFFPAVACGGAAYLGYRVFSDMEHPDSFYQHLGNTLGVVAIVCVALSLLFVVRAALADNVLLCIGRMCGALCTLVPVISLAGIVWSVVKLVQAGDSYHSCEVHRCIWDAC